MTSDSLRTCPVCGNKLEDDSMVCDECGFNFAGSTQVYQALEEDVSLPALDVEAASKTPVLQVVKGPLMGTTFQVNPITILGRDPKATIFLNDMTVSRKHARITLDPQGAKLEDLGSLNGTWVNGAIVTEADLVDGTAIQIGTFSLVFHLVEE